MSAALFDIDGTLIGGPSCERRFLAHLAGQGWIGPSQALQCGLALARLLPRHGRHAFKKNKAYLAGLDVEDVSAFAARFVAAEILPRLRPQLVDRLRLHQRRGEPVALLSGAPDFIVAPLAAELACAAWQGSSLAAAGGRFLADPPSVHPFAEGKVAAAEALCARLGTALSDAVSYADSVFDLPLLERVARPVIVCPGRRLADIARARGWEIIEANATQQLAGGRREARGLAGR